MKVIDTSVGITPAKTAGGVIDPHTWMSTTSARIICKNICAALCSLQPQDSTYFKAQQEKFIQDVICQVESDMSPYLQQAKEKREKQINRKETRFPFVIYHPALTYFAKDHSLDQYPIEEEGREPSITQLQALIDKAKKEMIKTVFIQKEFANRNTQTFIDATGAKPMEINPLAYDWDKQMVDVARKLAESYTNK